LFLGRRFADLIICESAAFSKIEKPLQSPFSNQLLKIVRVYDLGGREGNFGIEKSILKADSFEIFSEFHKFGNRYIRYIPVIRMVMNIFLVIRFGSIEL
jgi:hypothetical protein